MSELEKFLRKDIVERLARLEEMTSEVMNSDAAARFLGMSKSTFDKITSPKNMLIPASKIGKTKRFMKKDLLAFVERNKQEAITV